MFYAAVVGKAGKEVVTNEVMVSAKDGIGVASGETAGARDARPYQWTAWQNLWKRADTKAAQPVFKNNIVVEHHFGEESDKNNTVKITFKKDGAVSFSGKIGGVSVSGSSQLVRLAGDGSPYRITFYAPPKPTAKPPFDGWCETFDVKLTTDKQNIVTAVELGGAEPEMVQLWEGGPYWATKNIGAEKPEDYGLYFWWGDTTGHRPSASGEFDFDFSNTNIAIYTYGKSESLLKSEGWLTDDGVLAPEHDAAHVHWGGKWRMPTDQELQGLVDKCDWSPTTVNGVDGCLVRGRGGYASNSIFLPCGGSGDGISLYDAGWLGYCWSSVQNSDGYFAWQLYFYSDYLDTDDIYSYYGYSIRPVQSPDE